LEDRDLLAAIGEVVIDAAALEYAIAGLVAVADGLRDQACEDRAVAIVKDTGRAMKELRKLARAQPERNLMRLWRDAKSVLDDRHVIAHSLAMENAAGDDGQAGLVIFHPRSRRETTLTTSAILSHAHDIRITYRRFAEAIAAETADTP
jgi:hypothetical protein